MPEQLPKLDASSTEWLMHARRASLNSTFCTMPQKYFDVLQAWGYVEGTATTARLTGTGLSLTLAAEPKKTRSAPKKKRSQR